jgi:tetratricopeptide (TPR) repeat protein
VGVLSWLFPSPAERAARRLAAARAAITKGRFAEARAEALELEGEEAKELLALAEDGLVRVNLEHARSWARAGDETRVGFHLELVNQWRTDAHAELLHDALADIRQLLAERRAQDHRAETASAASLEDVAPGFLATRGEEAPLPEGVSEEEAEAVRNQLAMLLEAYPDTMAARVSALGPPFAEALIDLDDGRAEAALTTLASLPDEEPLVQHVRAKAALALGDAPAAARALRAFATLAGGHQRVGDEHTAELHAVALVRAGQNAEALEVLQEARRTEPKLGGILVAQLLHALGRLPEAEAEVRQLLKVHGTHEALYVLAARIRLDGGQRAAARDALETGMDRIDCVPGRCGSRPPDLALHRLLATLMLEDGDATPRALEIADTAAALVRQPTWEDVYLAALAARARGEDWAPLASRLREVTPADSPEHARLEAHLAA